jgi:hypothetical protein
MGAVAAAGLEGQAKITGFVQQGEKINFTTGNQ